MIVRAIFFLISMKLAVKLRRRPKDILQQKLSTMISHLKKTLQVLLPVKIVARKFWDTKKQWNKIVRKRVLYLLESNGPLYQSKIRLICFRKSSIEKVRKILKIANFSTCSQIMTRVKKKMPKALGKFMVVLWNEVDEWNRLWTIASGLTHHKMETALMALTLTLKMDLKSLRTECHQANFQLLVIRENSTSKQILSHLRI